MGEAIHNFMSALMERMREDMIKQLERPVFPTKFLVELPPEEQERRRQEAEERHRREHEERLAMSVEELIRDSGLVADEWDDRTDDLLDLLDHYGWEIVQKVPDVN